MRPMLRSVVLDTTDPRALADFYHHLLGYPYGPGYEPGIEQAVAATVAAAVAAVAATAATVAAMRAVAVAVADEVDWILLESPAGGPYLAFQKVDVLPRVHLARPPRCPSSCISI